MAEEANPRRASEKAERQVQVSIVETKDESSESGIFQ